MSYCCQTYRLSVGHCALEISGLPWCYELAAACTAALLNALIAKEVAVPRRATQEFTSSSYLETFGDGFTCFLHEKLGKEEEDIAPMAACKGEKREISERFLPGFVSNSGIC